MSNENKKSELEDFFSVLSEEKEATRKKEQAARKKIKEKIEDPTNELSSLFAQLSNTLEESKKSSVVQQKKVDSISELMTSFVEEGPPKIVTEIKSEPVVEIEPEPVIKLEPEPVIELEPEPVVETISVPEIEEHSIVSNTVETIKKASPSEVKEQIDPFLELKIEFDKFKTHVQNHISKQGFAGAGSGEVRLEFLDDVQSSTAKVDGKFLKYSSSDGKWVGADASGSGSSAIADLDIDGGTDIGAAIADADLFIVDDGAGGTNRKTAASRIKTYVADVTLTTAAQGNITSLGTLTALTVDNVVINGTTIGHTDDTDLMTVADGVLTVAGELDAATLDISGNADIDGTLEADAITVDGTALDEFIADTVGAMVSSNTETGITVSYQDSDNTLDFVIGTLNQDTTGNAATATALETARTIHGVSFDGSANIDLTEVVQDTVGAMFGSNTETGVTVTYQDSDGTIDVVVGTLNQDTTGNAATATALETARTIHGVSFDGTANIDLTEVVQDTVGAMFSSNTETGVTVTYQDGDGTIDVVVGTLNQDTTGNAATATALETARNIGGVSFDGTANINLPGVNTSGSQDTSGNAATATALATARTIHGVSFDGTGNIDLSEVIQDTVGAMFGSNTETGITVTYQDSDGTIDLVVGTLNQDTTGNAATATALETARTIHGVSFDGTANIDLTEVVEDTVGAMVSSNTETGLSVTYQDGDGTLDFAIAAAQTTITSLLATDIKIGEDDQTKVDFGTANEIHFYADNANQIKITDGAIVPATDNDIDLGTSSVEFKDAYFDGTVTADAFAGPINGDLTGTLQTAAQGNVTSLGTLTALTVDNVVINGATIGHGDDTDLMTVADGVLTVAGELDAATLDISGNADIDGTLEADAYTVNGTALDEFISDTVGAMVGSNTETGIAVTYQDGDNTIDFVIDAAQTAITSIYNSSLAIGYGASHANINFGTDNQITFDIDGTGQVVLKDGMFHPVTDSDVDLGKSDKYWKDAYIDTVTTTGLITSGGNLVIADAGNIGSASDTDAIAIASNGVVTFSQAPVFPDGSIAVADLDIDGATDIGAAIADADLFIVDDGAGGTNRKTTASRLKTYIGSPALDVAFESSATDITMDSIHTFSHSLGVRPTLVEVWVKCTDGERGWATGDYLLMAGAGGVGGTIDAGLSIQADATNVEVLAGPEIRIHDQSTFNEVSLQASKWDFVVVAYGGDLG